MEALKDLIRNNQSFLLKRVLYYAKLHGYVKYTSTLEEAWVVSISGLSEALLNCISNDNQIPEIKVDQEFTNDPISNFGVIEAKRHRQRGISLEMFLGLMKYYRQSYLDLITESIQDMEQQCFYLLWINCFFDHNEIAFCKEWDTQLKDMIMSELQSANRDLSNEKNKYLTIFESIPTPIVLLDAENRCKNMNYAAQQLLQEKVHSPGFMYYNDSPLPKVDVVLPWIIDEYNDFCLSGALEAAIEKDFESPKQGRKSLNVKFHRMLDVSGKFTGIVIIFTDLTERKRIEEQLRHMSFYDTLTGLYNRAYMDQEIIRISTGRFDPIGVISCDVDGLKLVNDNLGHNAGDVLMAAVGHIIRKCFRKSDVAFRVGGDEFIALIPSSDESAVLKACQRMRNKLAEHNSINLKMPVSISIGWASGNLSDGRDVHDIIKEADARMYMDKKENHSKYAALFMQRLDIYGQELFK